MEMTLATLLSESASVLLFDYGYEQGPDILDGAKYGSLNVSNELFLWECNTYCVLVLVQVVDLAFKSLNGVDPKRVANYGLEKSWL